MALVGASMIKLNYCFWGIGPQTYYSNINSVLNIYFFPKNVINMFCSPSRGFFYMYCVVFTLCKSYKKKA